MADTKAKLTLNGDTAVELDVLKGTLGQDVIDIRTLGSKGVFTFDPGFTSTASCESKITFIDGDEGILLHRGFPIDQLATDSNYLEVCYILLNGEKPTQEQYDEFKTTVTRHTMIHEQITRLFHAFRRDSHPMAVMCGITGALAAFYHDSLDVNNPRHREIAAFRLLSKMPTMAAMCYKYSIGQPFVYPRNDLSYAGNFLNMMFHTSVNNYLPSPIHVNALNKLLILHADHEQNCSTSAVRLVGSSDANLYASVTAGVCALWGSKHGGANQAVMDMLQKIKNEGLSIDTVIEKAKSKTEPFRLFGFGHRVYKTFDPRAKIAKDLSKSVMEASGVTDELLDIALELEERATHDDYFIERNLYPNVDFYTGITFHMMGIPVSMFTVLFAMGRLPGWIAHYLEWRHDPYQKIGRPRQIYSGPEAMTVVPIAER